MKLYRRLDKELEGKDRVFLKVLKNDINELEPIDAYTEYLTDPMAEYDRQNEQNNYSDYDEENIGCQIADDDGKELHFYGFVEGLLKFGGGISYYNHILYIFPINNNALISTPQSAVG